MPARPVKSCRAVIHCAEPCVGIVIAADHPIHLRSASNFASFVRKMVGKAKHRSGCPVSIALEMFGDRWSLLIVRDMMIRGFGSFKDFQNSGEGIASNVLTSRLRALQAAGIIRAEADDTDRRRVYYRLTEKGIDLAPALLELLIWGARHENTGAPCARVKQMAKHREALLLEVRRRWAQRDPTPLQAKTGEWRWP